MPVSLQFATCFKGPCGRARREAGFLGCARRLCRLHFIGSRSESRASPTAFCSGGCCRPAAYFVPVAAATANARNSWQWSQPPLDPFKTSNLAIGNDSTAFPAGFGSAGSAREFSNPGQMGPVGFNPLVAGRRGLAGGRFHAQFEHPVRTGTRSNPPSLNQLMRGSWNQPLDASAGTSRLSFRGPFHAWSHFGGLAHPPMTGLYSTTDLGNGMFLSAGTSFGHSNAGAPAAVMGGNAADQALRAFLRG